MKKKSPKNACKPNEQLGRQNSFQTTNIDTSQPHVEVRGGRHQQKKNKFGGGGTSGSLNGPWNTKKPEALLSSSMRALMRMTFESLSRYTKAPVRNAATVGSRNE